MKIYEFKGFPNPARIRMGLAEKGLTAQAEFVSVNVPEGEHREDAFRAINDQCTVPALELDDGTVICECSAILDYLDNVDENPVLTGGTARDRAIITMIQRRVEAGFLDAVATYFHHATPGLGPKLELDQNAVWGRAQRDRAVATMRWMDTALDKQDWLCAGRFTVADITAYAGFLFAGFANIEIPGDCPNVAAYKDRLMARDSARDAA